MKNSISAGGVVLNKKGQVLVVNQNNDSWSLPKGRVEQGEELLDAAKREIAEESGVTDLRLIKQLPSYKRFQIALGGIGENRSVLRNIHMFLFTTTDEKLTPSDPENPEAKWVNRDEVSELLTHPKDKEFFQSVMFELEN